MLLNQVQNDTQKQDVEVTSAFRSKKKKKVKSGVEVAVLSLLLNLAQ